MKRCLAVLVVLMAVSIFSYQARAEILGYPWSTWGELSYSPSNDIEEGAKLDMYVEQGIDWTKLGSTDWVFNSFGLGAPVWLVEFVRIEIVRISERGERVAGAQLARIERGQGGRYLDVAMLDAVASWMLPIAGGFLFSQSVVPARGRLPLAGGLPSYHVYQTADDQLVTFAALEPNLWADFCAAVSRPDLNARQFDPAATADMAALFREKTRAGWLTAFQGKDICVEPVNTFGEAWRDPQFSSKPRSIHGKRQTPSMSKRGRSVW